MLPGYAEAGPNNGICDSKEGASIPGGFLIDACYDGDNLILENHSSLVLRANTEPYVAPPNLSPTGTLHTIPSQVVINHEGFKPRPDPYLLPPDSRLTIPAGRSGNQISIERYQDWYFYDIANVLFTISATGGVSTAMVELVNELGSVYTNFRDCLGRSNFIGDAGCATAAITGTRKALDVAAAKGVLALGQGVLKLAGRLVDAFDILISEGSAYGDLGRFESSEKTITIAAVPDSPPTTSTTQKPPSNDRPETGPDPTTPTSSVPPSTTLPPPPPPPPAPTTYTETSGGEVHTWTDYRNAGGTEGPTVPAYASIQIECKIRGFAVLNGNTWWYRIAQHPWNGMYYGSADAFYNNGQTSGSLVGTPYVDPAVRDC